MNVKVLIDSIVRQTTVLIAQLSTTRGMRAPLSHVANQVFLELSRELDAQGISRKVSADMFGMALRSYKRRVQGLNESASDRGRSLWESVLDHVSRAEVCTRGQVMKRFSHDDPHLVRGVLRDLTASGLLFRSGSGEDQIYRATTSEEQRALGKEVEADGLDALLWAYIYREGPVSRADIEAFATASQVDLGAALGRLLSQGEVLPDEGGREPRFRAESLRVRHEAEVGFEAAVFDHYRAVVQTICRRLTPEHAGDALSGRLGGSTYTLDVWPEHPLAQDAYAVLSEFRKRYGELYARIEAYNAAHGRPQDFDQVVIYCGQHVEPRRQHTGEDV